MNGFSVPIHLKDLEIGGGKYVVDGDKAATGAPKDAKEQRQEIERIRAELENNGAPSVVAEFDALYVLTRDAEQLDAQARSSLAQVLCETALGVASASEALKPGATLDKEDLDEGRRAFVMAAVLAQAVVEKCDTISMREKTLKDKKIDLVEEIKLLNSILYISLNLLAMLELTYKLIKQLRVKHLRQQELLLESMVVLFM